MEWADAPEDGMGAPEDGIGAWLVDGHGPLGLWAEPASNLGMGGSFRDSVIGEHRNVCGTLHRLHFYDPAWQMLYAEDAFRLQTFPRFLEHHCSSVHTLSPSVAVLRATTLSGVAPCLQMARPVPPAQNQSRNRRPRPPNRIPECAIVA